MPTVVLILFLILRKKLNLRFLGPSSSKHSSSFFFFLAFVLFRFFNGTCSDKTHAERYDMINIFRTCSTTKYFPTSHPSRFPGSSLCTELWGIWGVCSRKGLATMLFFRNLLWMFITFHKQVSVIKTYRPPSTLPLTPPSMNFPFLPSLNQPFFFCLFFKFLFLSTKSCDILCIFKQLIRVLLCFYSRDYEYCCCRCCCCSRCCYLRKSFYQKRHFFVTRNYEKHHSMCDTWCTSLPCLSYNYKRTQTKKLS